ncbi:hypothetical protein LINPERPRIM_LOCUS30194 [Linum perenne]
MELMSRSIWRAWLFGVFGKNGTIGSDSTRLDHQTIMSVKDEKNWKIGRRPTVSESSRAWQNPSMYEMASSS